MVTAAVVMVGCGGDDTATTTSTSTIPETTTSTTTTTMTTATTTSTAAPETTVAATIPEGPGRPAEDEDWVAIIQQLLNTRTELYATADPSRTSEVCVADSFLCQNLIAQLTDLQERGERVEGRGTMEILSSTLDVADINDGIEFASVRTEIRLSDEFGRIVDSDGNTVFHLVPSDPDAPREGVERWTLVNTEVGWRLFDQATVS